jgi:transposase
MDDSTRFVGLDVHCESIAVAISDSGRNGEVRYLGVIKNTFDSLKRLLKKIGNQTPLKFCYEAGPCGYVVYRWLTELKCDIEVVAPTLIPTRPGDRVKTDRRDAEKLAQFLRAGELTPVWVPSEAHEALRDITRARESAKKDETRARNRLSKFLLRHDRKPKRKMTKWSARYMDWLDGVRFSNHGSQATMVDYLAEVQRGAERVARLERNIDDALAQASTETQEMTKALQTLRGVAKTTAVTIAAEVGQMSRFSKPTQLMSYAGIVPCEHSSGGPGRSKRGGLTKTGNCHLRRVLVESAWAYRHRPAIKGRLKKRQEGQSVEVKDIAWNAQTRLCEKYLRLTAREKPKQKVIAAIARELLGFAWSIGVEVEKQNHTI